ncbi:uncharacterized protein A1O5_09735 [Cladophialophora psammophila CBS 110553]|uniref:Uncharacterized protein n=1 Tax=Cladophialophora psammophila CBS 110553 TaxID=1182543 RepID=W9X9G6_9EURO|nr:uncharacterized protein A1O5_09735 [Cladophialophora psammophila CBS 110553]EXJ67089.1 hypothetical protein A1O5_09735 [Cladophialophora psammophila CBS 110553]
MNDQTAGRGAMRSDSEGVSAASPNNNPKTRKRGVRAGADQVAGRREKLSNAQPSTVPAVRGALEIPGHRLLPQQLATDEASPLLTQGWQDLPIYDSETGPWGPGKPLTDDGTWGKGLALSDEDLENWKTASWESYNPPLVKRPPKGSGRRRTKNGPATPSKASKSASNATPPAKITKKRKGVVTDDECETVEKPPKRRRAERNLQPPPRTVRTNLQAKTRSG